MLDPSGLFREDWTDVEATNDRAGRISIVDKGSTVDVPVDVDGSPFTDALFVATLKTSDLITVGQDVLVGS